MVSFGDSVSHHTLYCGLVGLLLESACKFTARLCLPVPLLPVVLHRSRPEEEEEEEEEVVVVVVFTRENRGGSAQLATRTRPTRQETRVQRRSDQFTNAQSQDSVLL